MKARKLTIDLDKFDNELEKYLENCSVDLSESNAKDVKLSELTDQNDEEPMSSLMAVNIHNIACKCSTNRDDLIEFAKVYENCHMDDTPENTVDWYLRTLKL